MFRKEGTFIMFSLFCYLEFKFRDSFTRTSVVYTLLKRERQTIFLLARHFDIAMLHYKYSHDTGMISKGAKPSFLTK